MFSTLWLLSGKNNFCVKRGCGNIMLFKSHIDNHKWFSLWVDDDMNLVDDAHALCDLRFLFQKFMDDYEF